MRRAPARIPILLCAAPLAVAGWSPSARAQPEERGVDEDTIPEDEGEDAVAGEEAVADDGGETTGGETGRDEREPTRREARLVEQYDLGTPAIVHRLTAPGGVTARYMRAAGGEQRPSYLSYPVAGARLGRGFGSGINGRHKALDIIADGGTAIRAAERGLVVYADDTVRGYGWMVVLLHPGGWITFYAHCSRLLVHPGQTVERREVIAGVGSTGIARGEHLHFTLFINGEVTDPYPFFRPPPPNLPYVGPAPHRGHRVRPGDTVAAIAERFGVEEAALRVANGLADDDEINDGWQLLIPGQLEPRPEPAAAGRRYTVREGDTLSEIAQRFGTTTAVLIELNHLEDPSKIQPGDDLRVPGSGGESDSSATEPSARPDTSSDDIYVVGPGETLTRIARRTHVSVAAIMRANRMRDADDIREGQELVIPRGEAEAEGGTSSAAATRPYTVREGDSLSRIARRNHCTVQDIRDLNGDLSDADSIRPGDVIRVPRDED